MNGMYENPACASGSSVVTLVPAALQVNLNQAFEGTQAPRQHKTRIPSSLVDLTNGYFVHALAGSCRAQNRLLARRRTMPRSGFPSFSMAVSLYPALLILEALSNSSGQCYHHHQIS